MTRREGARSFERDATDETGSPAETKLTTGVARSTALTTAMTAVADGRSALTPEVAAAIEQLALAVLEDVRCAHIARAA